jgi:hypothetical protein
MSWVIRLGPKSSISLASAMEIVVTSLEYMQAHPHVRQERLLAEAVGYAKDVRRWVRDNEPPPPPHVPERDRHGKPGPMSDG